MRKQILIMALMLLGLAGVSAQTVLPDSTSTTDTTTVEKAAPASVPTPTLGGEDEDDEENVIGGRVERRQPRGVELQRTPSDKEANILGMPIYYDTLGNVIGDGRPTPRGGHYRRPKHHYFNNLSDQYCGFFCEATGMIGPADIAGGFNLTYLPERWGAYGSALFGVNHSYLTVGPALRLSGYDSRLDWQLYSGIVFGGMHVGAEAGVRLALPQQRSDFCWSSASMGLGVINGDTYFTLGLSLQIVAFSTLGLFLLW